MLQMNGEERVRYLLYRDYESGLCNNWMGLELAAGLSHLTGRQLVLYGSVGAEKHLMHVRGGYFQCSRPGSLNTIDNSRCPGLLDLLDELPFSRLTFTEFEESCDLRSSSIQHCESGLTNCVFVSNNAIDVIREGHPDHPLLTSFCDGRQVLQDPADDVWHHSLSNLGFYSRIFFKPSKSLFELLSSIKPARPYRELAAKITQSLGLFNGVHIRLTDFRQFLPQADDYCFIIADTLKAIFPSEQLLLISTDESQNKEFFAPVTDVFRRHLFLDEFILSHFAEEFRALPFRDEQTLGLICNQVLWSSRDFAGTPGSTFTGLIHRHWYRNCRSKGSDVSHAFKFVSSGIPGAGSDIPGVFSDGAFVESIPGDYSWNRSQIPKSTDALSWYREWPEAVQE